MTACPFDLCSAEVEMVAEIAAPGPDPQALRRVPQHKLVPLSEFGLCPASLMLVPLSSHDQQQLDQQGAVIQRMLDDRIRAKQQAAPEKSAPTGDKPEHEKDPRWFKPNAGGSTRHHPPLQGFTAMGQILTSGPQPTTGGNMATVAEVRAAIDRAIELVAEGQEQVRVAGGKLAEGLQVLNFVRQASTDPIGAPEVLEAIEKLEEAAQLCRRAVETAALYKGTVL